MDVGFGTVMYPEPNLKIVGFDTEKATQGSNKNGGARINQAGIYVLGDPEPHNFVIDSEMPPFCGHVLLESYVEKGTLTAEDIAHPFKFIEIADRIFDLLDGAIVIAHNGHGDLASLKSMYDLTNAEIDKQNVKIAIHNSKIDSLNAECTLLCEKLSKLEYKSYKKMPIPYEVIDTHTLAKRFVKDPELTNGLRFLCETWRIQPIANHNAGIDAMACVRLFVVLCNRYPILLKHSFRNMFYPARLSELPPHESEWLGRASYAPEDGTPLPETDGQFSMQTVLGQIDPNPELPSPPPPPRIRSRFFRHTKEQDPTPLDSEDSDAFMPVDVIEAIEAAEEADKENTAVEDESDSDDIDRVCTPAHSWIGEAMAHGKGVPLDIHDIPQFAMNNVLWHEAKIPMNRPSPYALVALNKERCETIILWMSDQKRTYPDDQRLLCGKIRKYLRNNGMQWVCYRSKVCGGKNCKMKLTAKCVAGTYMPKSDTQFAEWKDVVKPKFIEKYGCKTYHGRRPERWQWMQSFVEAANDIKATEIHMVGNTTDENEVAMVRLMVGEEVVVHRPTRS